MKLEGETYQCNNRKMEELNFFLELIDKFRFILF